MSYNLKQSTPKILYYKINTEETKFQKKIKKPSQKSTKMVNIRVTDEELLDLPLWELILTAKPIL